MSSGITPPQLPAANYFVLIHGHGRVELFMAKGTTHDVLAERCAGCVLRGHEVHIYELKPSTVGCRIQQVPDELICLRQVFHDHPAEVEFEDLKTSIGGVMDGHSYTMAEALITQLQGWLTQQMDNVRSDKPIDAQMPIVEEGEPISDKVQE